MGTIIKSERIDLAPRLSVGCEHGGRGGASATVQDPGTEAEVRLHREGELIKAIEILCPCGRQLLLECDYEQSAMGLVSSLNPGQEG